MCTATVDGAIPPSLRAPHPRSAVTRRHCRAPRGAYTRTRAAARPGRGYSG